MKQLKLAICITVLMIPVFSQAAPRTHSHAGRTHTHLLPSEGIGHRHNYGAIGASASSSNTQQTGRIRIPESTSSKYPNIIKALQEAPSVNAKEMQYWVNVLPVMTQEQIRELEDILGDERDRLDMAKLPSDLEATPVETGSTYASSSSATSSAEEKETVPDGCRVAKATSTGFTALTMFTNAMVAAGRGESMLDGAMKGRELAAKEKWVNGIKYTCR